MTTRRRKAVSPPTTIRVAVYTRQSVADDKEFGSIDAQREAVEAYVKSQRGEGWEALPDRYDDGGFSGANTERPALTRLLADIEAGKVDAVAVYKIDRLSRSLLDFAQLMGLFERHRVAFVSVTQQFSTASSMGRLTLNILMSFAEFERETIAERTRDKVLASRKKGMWTGGRPVLGYDVVDKQLAVNEDEAALVRRIFQVYLDCGSLQATLRELDHLAIRNKSWINQKDTHVTGSLFTKSSLSNLLTNPLYVGQVRCGDEVFDGQHDPIIEQETWEVVQQQLQDHRGDRGSPNRNKWDALLRGLLICGRCGQPMAHHFTKKAGRTYSYYVCKSQLQRGAAACPGSRVPAGEIEAFVVDKIRTLGRDANVVSQTAAAVRRQAEARQTELQAETRRLDRDAHALLTKRRNLVEAIAGGSNGTDALTPELEILDRQIAQLTKRRNQVESELCELQESHIDEADLRRTLTDFGPVWDELRTREQERVLNLLIERITYDASAGRLDIAFRSAGVGSLAADGRRTA